MSNLVRVVSAAIIDDGWILLVRKNGIYIPPGGKIKPGESQEECLRREIREELSDTEVGPIRQYRPFIGRSISGDSMIKAMIYFTSIHGKLGKPSAEIEGYAWVHRDTKDCWRVSEATRDMMNALYADGLF
ncbi:MAG: NUDIX domain-containing protein [Nanoarchaeota archaeon]|nr:NUDIX domain-containing protein [Nanoarchaeota archaeon]